MVDEHWICGQKISAEKLELAKAMRREMTVAEEKLWNVLRKNRLGGFHFRRQQILAGFIVDFYCHAAQLIVEVDGAVHGEQRRKDEARDRILAEHGFYVIRVRNEAVMKSLELVLDQIYRLCLERAGRDQVSPRSSSMEKLAAPTHLGEERKEESIA